MELVAHNDKGNVENAVAWNVIQYNVLSHACKPWYKKHSIKAKK